MCNGIFQGVTGQLLMLPSLLYSILLAIYNSISSSCSLSSRTCLEWNLLWHCWRYPENATVQLAGFLPLWAYYCFSIKCISTDFCDNNLFMPKTQNSQQKCTRSLSNIILFCFIC